MDIRLDPDSPTPPYEQVRLRIAALAADGTLPAGHKLPPVRTLAADLGLAVNTVARAYRELENHGVVIGRVRHGTVVAEHTTTEPISKAEADRRLADAAATYALAVKQLGVSVTDAVAAVTAHLNPSTRGG